MKNIIFSIITLVAIAVVTISCNQSSNKNNNQQTNDSTAITETQDLSAATQNDTTAAVTSRDTLSQKVEKSAVKEQAQNFSIEPIVKDYLVLKNALVADNDKAAANAGKQLFATLSKVDMKTIAANKHKEFVKGMIPHHAAAVLMSEKAKLTDPELIQLQKNILEKQAQEIEFMKRKLNEFENK